MPHGVTCDHMSGCKARRSVRWRRIVVAVVGSGVGDGEVADLAVQTCAAGPQRRARPIRERVGDDGAGAGDDRGVLTGTFDADVVLHHDCGGFGVGARRIEEIVGEVVSDLLDSGGRSDVREEHRMRWKR